MSDYDSLCKAVGGLAGTMKDLQRQAAESYAPVVEELLNSRSSNAQAIEHTLDGLFDFCGDDSVLELFKRLCRHYWTIDPAATVRYVQAYREYWDSAESGAQP
jgi:hypothetical protein